MFSGGETYGRSVSAAWPQPPAAVAAPDAATILKNDRRSIPLIVSPSLQQAAEKGPSAEVRRWSLLAQRGSLTLARISGSAPLASGSARQAEYASLVASLAASHLDLLERPAGFFRSLLERPLIPPPPPDP